MNNRFIRRAVNMPVVALTALAMTAISISLSLPAWAQSDSSSSATSSTSNSSSSDSSSDSSSSGSSGVLWTAPQYQVKPVGRKPAASSMPADIAPGQGSAASAAASNNDGSAPNATVSTTTTDGTTTVRRKKRRKADAPTYDEAAAKAFSEAISTEPQYVWLSPDRPSPAAQSKFQQNRVLASTETLNRLDTYIKDLSQSIQANVSVPGSAQLVETANRKYSYLVSFVVKNSGQISNITNEKQVGALSSVPLADDDENGQVVKAITKALGKVSPVKVPPAGFAPWYMLLKYDVNSGNVFVACLNAK
ncbi:MAG: hypothetical protein C0508_04365 [Cyanobacteria bacterium PR.023]|jgi:hypothetical protein|nr:hypothetical protein [Cyanobacteria bacterium PR.023]MDQ5933973.1 hypothetical protein [Cyanobacteriota bacterium erpe_2018_sw_21hr_WHONDRS-SW48-000092_B_bin.40]